MISRLSLSTFLAILTLSFSSYTYSAPNGNKGPVEVIVAPVVLKQFADRVEALGTTKANESVIITPDTTEKVIAIHFDDGQLVKQGDLLVTLDQSEETADLRAVEATLSEARSAYQRARDLQKSNALSKSTLQERLSVLKQTEASAESIKARIDKLTITAPFDGVLGIREVSVGTLVQPGDVITSIDDLDKIKVDFNVPSLFLSALRQGLPITGRVEAFGNREFTGEVSTVNTRIDPVTRTVRVRAILPNPDHTLKPGLLMNIALMRNPREALLIPEEALIKRGNDNFVYVPQEQEGKLTAQLVQIEIGYRRPGEVEVISGLTVQDHVVSHGAVKIKPGTEISIRATQTEEDVPLSTILKRTENKD